MKKYISLLLLIFTFFLKAQTQHNYCSKAYKSFRKIKSAELKSSDLERMEKFNLTYVMFYLDVSNNSTEIKGNVLQNGYFYKETDSILLELHSNYIIDSVLINDTKVNYRRLSNLIITPCNSKKFSINIFYHGSKKTPQDPFMGGSGIINGKDLSTQKSVTYTLSEPFSASEWWPSKQSLNDKIDSADLFFKTSNPNLVGSNGVLIEKIKHKDSTIFHWKTKYPTSYYLFSFSVGPYMDYSFKTKIKNLPDSLLVQNFIYNDSSYLKNNKENIELTGDYLQIYSNKYGAYPFSKEKYGHCLSTIGGGMEHQTMTTLNSFDPYLVSHELAHQWFGDHVTCGSFQDIWLNEGFATYSEYLMYESLFPSQKNELLSYYQNSAKTQKNGSVWVKDTINENRIFSRELTYDKGASIIHTLRFIINNDSLFFEGLRNYQNNFAFSFARVTDFKNTMENTTKIDLTNFFNEWYFGEGYPIYSYKTELSDSIRIFIKQSTTSNVTTLFTTPIEILFSRTNLKDTIIRFNISKNESVFTFSNDTKLNAVKSLDPNNYLIKGTSPYLNITDLINETIAIFPNPTIDKLTIITKQPNTYNIKLLDIKGIEIYNSSFISDVELNTSNLLSGIYFLQISNNEYYSTYRIVKE